MLPGLRILFAITLLSVSVLIFGLGAAAFLRSAHENFASAPWRPIETPATARVDLAPPTLAMLRVEPETTLPADRIDLPAAISTPRESKTPADTPTAARAAADAPPPRAEQVEATAKPAAPEPASAPPAQTNAPQSEQESPIAKTPSETAALDTSVAPAVAEVKIAETKQPQGAPAVVAALNPENTEAAAKIASEPAPVAAAPSPAAETPASAAPTATAPGNDTLKADDKTIDAAPAKIAALSEPALAEVAPLPVKDVKIPTPRLDPAVAEATRLRILSQQRARAARAAKARRVAAVRARAAAQAKAAAATNNPFGAPANTTTTSSR